MEKYTGTTLSGILDARRLIIAFSMVVLLVILVIISSLYSNRVQNDVRLYSEIQLGIEGLLSSVKDAETGQRGYLLTGNVVYLTPYLQAQEEVGINLDRLSELLETEPLARAAFQRVGQLINLKLDELALTIELYQDDQQSAALEVVRSDIGQQYMSELRAELSDLSDTQNQNLILAQEQSERVGVILISLSALALAGFVLSLWMVFTYLQKGYQRQLDTGHALARSEAIFRELTENIAAVFWMRNAEGTEQIYVSPKFSQIWGLSLDVLRNDPDAFMDSVHPEDREELNESFKSLLGAKPEEYNLNYRIVRPDGSIVWIHDRAFGIRQGDSLVRIGGLAEDITERKEQALKLELAAAKLQSYTNRLEQSNRELEQYAYIASHDLREPLRTMMSHTRLIESELELPADSIEAKSMGFIQEASARMSRMIQDLLEYSRIGQDRELESVDLNEVVRNTIHDLGDLISRNSADISFDTLPVVRANKTEMHILCENLISNALKFHLKERCPEICIRGQLSNQLAQIDFSDNGIGIPPGQRQRIFRLFQRLPTECNTEGSGIGLAHCQKIVEAHGGTISVETNKPCGSRFLVSLPQEGAGNE